MRSSRDRVLLATTAVCMLAAFGALAVLTPSVQNSTAKYSLQNANVTVLPSYIQNHQSQMQPEATDFNWPTPHDFAEAQAAVQYVSELLGPQYTIVESHAKFTTRRRFEELRAPTGFGISAEFLARPDMDDSVWVIGLRTVPPVHPQRLSDLAGIPVSEPWTPSVADYAATPGVAFVPGHLGRSGVPWSPGQAVVLVLDDPGNVIVAEYVELPDEQGTPVALNSWQLEDIDNLPSQ